MTDKFFEGYKDRYYFDTNVVEQKYPSLDDFIKEFIRLREEPRLMEIHVNPQYLPTFLDEMQAHQLPISRGRSGWMSLGYYTGVPLIMDEGIETYKMVMEERQT